MTSERETLRIVRSWMEEGRTRLPDHVLDAVLDQLPATPQRRPGWSARRIAHMNPIAKYAIATAAVVVIAIVGLNVFGVRGTSNVGGSPPSPATSPSPLSSPSPSAAPSSSLPPTIPTSGAIAPGRYRWMSPLGREVTFVVPNGWTGTSDGTIAKHADTPAEIGLRWNKPGTLEEVDRVYADACFSENKLQPIGRTANDLVAALDNQKSTDAVYADLAAGSVTGRTHRNRTSPGREPIQVPKWCGRSAPDLGRRGRDRVLRARTGSPGIGLRLRRRGVALRVQLCIGTECNRR